MKPNFSLNYSGRLFKSEENKCKNTPDGLVYELERGVTVTLKINEYEKYNAKEWVLYFENKNESDSKVISDICDCDTLLPLTLKPAPRAGFMPKEGDLCVITMNGMVPGTYYNENDKVSATEYGFNYEYIAIPGTPILKNTKTFSNINHRSSEGMMPFFDVTASGGGYVTAIGWTGGWKAEFTACEEGALVKTGLQNTKFYLKPGEKLRTSSILIMEYKNGEDKHIKFRRLIRNHFSHKSNTKAQRDGLMAFELWGGLTSDEMIKRIEELKKYDIKYEDVWIDAGWYGNCSKCDDPFTGDWGSHTGEWEINKRIHPDEFLEVSKCAKDAGMKLMLWFEPERAISGTPIVKEHPDWFLSRPKCKRGHWDNILYYGNDEAVEYVCNLLSDYIEKLDLSCYRQDFNTGLTDFFELNDEENRKGISEIKHIMGMYKIWDYLLEKFPELIIDNCSSGGRRIDIETLKRSIPFFRSDYQCQFNLNPEVLQTHNTNISAYLPYNGCTSKVKNDTYAMRSAYSSSWGGAFYNAIFQTMEEEDYKWAKQITDEYRYIRKYMNKDFYNHGSNVFDDTAWAIWQYHDEDTQSGIVMAFRRSKSPASCVEITLNGMENGKMYSYTDLDNGTSYEKASTIKIELPQKRSSSIIEYKINN